MTYIVKWALFNLLLALCFIGSGVLLLVMKTAELTVTVFVALINCYSIKKKVSK